MHNGCCAKSLTLAPSNNENAGDAEVSRRLAAICRTEATAVNGVNDTLAAGAGSGDLMGRSWYDLQSQRQGQWLQGHRVWNGLVEVLVFIRRGGG